MSLVERAYGWVQFLYLFFALYNWVGGDQKIHSKQTGGRKRGGQISQWGRWVQCGYGMVYCGFG